jgi:hypothetical protein
MVTIYLQAQDGQPPHHESASEQRTLSPEAAEVVRRGNLGSVRELTTAIRAYINGWNNRAHSFV